MLHAAKADHLLGLIKRSFNYLDSDMLVNPCNWGPPWPKKFNNEPQVASSFEKRRDMSYSECLPTLQLPSLVHRNHRGDLDSVTQTS